MRSRQFLIGVTFGAFIWLAALPAANAMPLFARKYGVPCSTCHTTIPRLNETGYKFRAAGFRMLADIGKCGAAKFTGRSIERFDVVDEAGLRLNARQELSIQG